MVFDKLSQLADTQAFAASGPSNNSYDLGGVVPREATAGEPLSLLIHVKVAAAGAGTYQFQAIESATADLASPNILASRIIAPALLTAGSVHELVLPQKTITLRFLGVNVVLGGVTPTVTASIYVVPSSTVARSEIYPRGYTQV